MIGVLICVAGLMWTFQRNDQLQRERERHRREMAAYYAERQAQGTSPGAPSASLAGNGTRGVAVVSTSTSGAIAEAPEERKRVTTKDIEAEFTNRGGGIARIKLLQHIAEGNECVVINQNGSVPIGNVTTSPGQQVSPEIFTLSELDGEGGRRVVATGQGSNGLRLQKTFWIPATEPTNDPYVFEVELMWTNESGTQITSPPYFVATGELRRIHDNDMVIYTGIDFFRQGNPQYTDAAWFNKQAIPLLGITTREAQSNFLWTRDKIDWVGVRNQFFASILTPRDTKGTAVFGHRIDLSTPAKPQNYAVEGAIGMPGFSVEPGGVHRQRFQLFAGPRELSRLKKLKNEEHQIIDYRIMGIGAFRWVSELLLHSLNGLKGIFGNYAAAIVVLTIVIKTLLFPLQNKATLEMKRMSLLSPRIAELRDKYKDDQQKLNEEIMKLYRDYGMNPFAGCLPMLIQIPIFFGFYSMLGTAVELRNAGFLWIKDLSQPDTVFRIGGLPVNILPLVMAATMFWQMAITPKTGDKMQQRIFMLMPMVFVLFCYNFASALALYWTVQNLFSIVQLYLTRNQPMPELKKVARVKNAREAFEAARAKTRKQKISARK